MEERTVIGGFAIVIVDKGFVFVGDTEITEDWCVIVNAFCIRKWGTTKGLGELALDGNNSNTVLDNTGTVRIPKNSLILTIDTEKTKWVY